MALQPVEILLAELIALPSVNPAFLPAKDPRAGEDRMVDFLASKAAAAGLDLDFQEVFPGRNNLLVHCLPRGQVKRRILLAPHLDTVGAVDMPDSMFVPTKKAGKLHGRGACDTKGSVAAMFQAVLNIAGSMSRPKSTEIIFVGLIDEENAQTGSRVLARKKLKVDLGIVGEPTELKLVTAHKGDLWLKLITRGTAAHGARPELGVNAVRKMAGVVEVLENQYARSLKKRKHPILGCGTINVGMIHGGTQPNIVPDYCEIQVDRRTIPGEDDEEVQAEMIKFIRGAGAEAELINSKTGPCYALETNPDLPPVREFMNLLGQKKPAGVDFFCDASILAHGGIPSVVFGPGNIAQAHTQDEWISLESLRGGTRFLEEFLQRQP